MTPNSGFDEHRWIIHIRRALDEELEDDNDIPVSIFNVPRSLVANNSNAYIPQQVALGPYHYWRPELYEMERYKLAAAKRTQKSLQSIKFQDLVDQLTKLEPNIRACYHKYLDFGGETLAWMMVVDASFVLEFLHIYTVNSEGRVFRRVTSRMSHLIDCAGGKSAHNAILRDMIMLENQIPLFLLRKILEFQVSSSELADDMLLSMLVGLCKVLSPFRLMVELSTIQLTDHVHMLDFLYHLILPKSEDASGIVGADDQNEASESGEKSSEELSFAKQLCTKIAKFLSISVSFLKRVLVARRVKSILRFPWIIISNLPIFRIFKQPVEYLCFSQDKEVAKPENQCSKESDGINKPPLVEEISIPSVTELSKAGISFVPSDGSILTLSYDHRTSSLYLPTVSLDVNAEVILRNLVAYEACTASGPLIFTRYTELMNGIIDTEEDAKVLRKRGIIINRLKSDEEVANLWNGMSRSLVLTKVPFLDTVIEDVNKYYNGRWRTKVGKVIKLYVFNSWQILLFMAAILLLLLMSIQVFSSMYRFVRIFNMRNVG